MSNNKIVTWIKSNPIIIFVMFSAIFGFIMIFNVLPCSSVLDGVDHLQRATQVSQGIWISPNKSTWVMGYSPVMYLMSGLGIKLFKVFYAGRIFNLFTWIILIAIAIRITPVFKWQFVFIALLPTSLFQGMSISADSFNNAFSFLFFAYMFRLIYRNQFSYKKDIPILLTLTIIGSLCKGAVFPLLLLPLIKVNKRKYLLLAFLLGIAVCVTSIWSHISLGALPNFVDTTANKLFILHHPISYCIILAKTISTNFLPWIYGCIGQLGWIQLDKKIILLTTLVYLLSFKFIPTSEEIKISHRVTAFILLLLYTVFTCTLLYFIYTPYGNPKIWGVQPRYFVQIIPVLFILFGQNKISHHTNTAVKLILIYIFMLLLHCTFFLV